MRARGLSHAERARRPPYDPPDRRFVAEVTSPRTPRCGAPPKGGSLATARRRSSLLADLEDREERLLRDLDAADRLHPLLAGLLLLEELLLARDVPAVALGEHVLAQR